MTLVLKKFSREESKDPANSGEENFLTFFLGGEEFAVNILSVQEIRSFPSNYRVSSNAEYIKGMMSLHQKIIPLFDLRIFFNIPLKEKPESDIVVIVNSKKQWVGFVVDSVLDIISVERKDIKPAPQFCKKNYCGYAFGVASFQNRLIVLLDLYKLVSEEKIQDIIS